jgi:glycosyltransferase involved in cell wall biosynthesis
MRIRFLLLTIDNLAGTERAAVTQANALADRHDVEIVSVLKTSARPRTDVDPRVRVRYLASIGGTVGDGGVAVQVKDAETLSQLPSTLVPPQWDPTLNALCDVAMTKVLPRLRADVVVTMTTGMLAAASQLLPSRVALVHQEHRSSMHRTAGLEPLLAFAPRADAVVSLTQVNAEWLCERLGRHAPPIHVVPNASPGAHQPQSLLDQPLIVAAGRLEPGKQYDHLIRAFGMIADEIPEWRLRIFGTGNNRGYLSATARRFGLYDRVEMPGATVDLAAEWAKASISAMASRLEAFPLVLVESLAAGVPTVAYDCPTGPSELIQHGHNGFLVPQGEEATLAGHLLRLATDRDLRVRMGKAALASLAPLDPAAITDRWEAIYADAVAARRASPTPWVDRMTMPGPAGAPAADGPATVGAAVPTVTPAESRRTVFGDIAAVLADVPDLFVLPARGDFPPTFVVPADQRGRVLDELEQGTLPPHLTLEVTETDHWHTRRGAVAATARAIRNSMVTGFSLGPWPVVDDTATHLAHRAGVRVEFWYREPTGALATRSPNPYASRVLPDDDLVTGVVEDVSVPVLAELADGPFVEQCRFPVDAVLTWVDDSDPAWQAARDQRMGRAPADHLVAGASGDARFRNRDELRYALRSLHLNAPWIRTIHLVTAGQRPSWLLDHPKVRLVDHREILPPDALPTFNSHAIEAGLHRIPDLSEHFVYLNDDVFLGRPLDPDTFFSSTGTFSVFRSPLTVGVAGRDDRPFIQAATTNRALLRERFGVVTTHTLMHSPHPLRRSVLEQIAAEFPDAVARTERSAFRGPDDVSMTSSMAQHFGLMTGSARFGELSTVFVDTSQPNLRWRLDQLRRREQDTFCLGDHHAYALTEQRVTELITEFLRDYFPVAPPWEDPHPEIGAPTS